MEDHAINKPYKRRISPITYALKLHMHIAY